MKPIQITKIGHMKGPTDHRLRTTIHLFFGRYFETVSDREVVCIKTIEGVKQFFFLIIPDNLVRIGQKNNEFSFIIGEIS